MVVCPKRLISSSSSASISSAVFTAPCSLSLKSRIASKRLLSAGRLRKRSIIWVSCSLSEIFFLAIPSLIEKELQKVQPFLLLPSTFFPKPHPLLITPCGAGRVRATRLWRQGAATLTPSGAEKPACGDPGAQSATNPRGRVRQLIGLCLLPLGGMPPAFRLFRFFERVADGGGCFYSAGGAGAANIGAAWATSSLVGARGALCGGERSPKRR